MVSKFLAHKIYALIDLTSLNETDNEDTLLALCGKTVMPFGHVAAVCVYPRFVKLVTQILANTSVKIATVANFPAGIDTVETVTRTIHETLQNGAQEIDVVFPYRNYLAGEKKVALEFVKACRNTCGEKILLKVILETGALKELSLITEVSQEVLLAGANFLKTSTGKIAEGATLPAAEVMLNTIKRLAPQLQQPLGFKVSGGVRTLQQAKEYMDLAARILGEDWVTPEHFRVGASQLVDQLI